MLLNLLLHIMIPPGNVLCYHVLCFICFIYNASRFVMEAETVSSGWLVQKLFQTYLAKYSQKYRSIDVGVSYLYLNTYTNLLQASEVCEVDISTIRKVTTVGNSQGTAFIVTLKDHDTAKRLHNNGRGDIRFYQSDKIEFFPVKAKDSWVPCWEDVLFELKWQGHFVLDQWCSIYY